MTETQDRKPEPVVGPASIVSAATMCSRLTGLLREAIFAALFATQGLADAFIFAFRIPNLLRDFFAEGALSSAFVPTFARTRAQEGDPRAFQLAARVMGTLGAVAALIVGIGIIFAPALVGLIALDAPEELRPLTIKLTRVMFPFLLVIAVAAVAMGVLNTHRRYFVPALAPMFFNVVAILGGGVLLLLGLDAVTAITVWAALVVVGGAAQLLIQVPALRAVGFRRRPEVDWRLQDPKLRQIIRRMGPVVLSLTATNIMLVIVTILASREQGWASSLNYAFRLVHLPIGVIGVALGTVVLSAGARRSAQDDGSGLDDVIRRGLRVNWLLALPAAAGLFVLAEPIVRLIYQRGAFGTESTRMVAEALRYYSVGIVFYAGVKAAAPQFLARGDTRSPVLCSLIGIAATLGVAFSLIGPLGFKALALAVAIGAAFNYGSLRLLARLQLGSASAPGWPFLLRCLLAVGIMAAAGQALSLLWLSGDQAARSGWWHGLRTCGVIGALGMLYFVVAARLGLDEGGAVRAWLRRRRGR